MKGRFLVSALLLLGGAGAGFVMHALLARLLGSATLYGQVAFYLSLATVASLLMGAGFPQLLIREMGRLLGAQRHGQLSAAVKRLLGLLALSTLGVALVLAGTGLIIGDDQGAWWLMMALATGAAWLLAGSCIVKGLQKPLLSLFFDTFLRPVLMVLALSIWLFGNRELSTMEALWLFVATTLALGLMLHAVAAWTLRKLSSAPKAYELSKRKLIGLALPMLITGGLLAAMNAIDAVMLRPLSSDAQTGYYMAAAKFSMLVALPLMAMNALFLPMFAKFFGEKDYKGMQVAAQRMMRLLLPLTLLICGVLVLCGSWLLGYFGDDYSTEGWLPLLVLIIAQCLLTLAGSNSALLNMTGHQRRCAYATGVCAGVNVVANLCLIPKMGAVGASYATLLSAVAWWLMTVPYMRQVIGVDTSLLGLWRKSTDIG